MYSLLISQIVSLKVTSSQYPFKQTHLYTVLFDNNGYVFLLQLYNYSLHGINRHHPLSTYDVEASCNQTSRAAYWSQSWRQSTLRACFQQRRCIHIQLPDRTCSPWQEILAHQDQGKHIWQWPCKIQASKWMPRSHDTCSKQDVSYKDLFRGILHYVFPGDVFPRQIAQVSITTIQPARND